MSVAAAPASIEHLDAARAAAMRSRSWHEHPQCPAFAELRVLHVTHWDFAGRARRGCLIVHASVADELAWVFDRLHVAGFPLESVQPIDAFGGDDELSMAANNSSAFNFRLIAGTRRLSQHAGGLAVDLNPVQNPWVREHRVEPAAGRAYLDRTHGRPGMIVRPGPVTNAFDAIGWSWGGDWLDTRDYHHFSKNPR